MATINYQFADGHYEEIEVTEEFKREYEFLLVQERALHWKEMQQKHRAGMRCINDLSLDKFTEDGYELPSPTSDPLEKLIKKKELQERYKKLLRPLSDKQREVYILHNMEKNYCDIWNACADFDNEHNGSYITDKISEYDFVTEDLLEYIVKENATDLSRLRCFINDTYDADIYMLDGYGNLQNVEESDFESLLDDIISDLQYDITVPILEEACL